MRINNVQNKIHTVLILYNDLGIGGIQRKIADIAYCLSTKKKYANIRVYLILDHKRAFDLEEDIFLNQVRQSKIEIFYRPQQKIWRIKFPLIVYVCWKILVFKPSAILSFMEKYSVIAIFMKYIFWWEKIKVIVSYDNIASLLIPIEKDSNFDGLIRKKLIRNFYPRADLVVVPSNKSKLDMNKNFGVPRKKITVNKNWVLSYGWKKGKNYRFDIIYTGRVDPVKNLSSFINVVKKVKGVYPAVKACIVGWGEEIDRISNLIHSKSLELSIELAGSQKNISKYLYDSKIFLLTSDFEGLPIAPLEAMAYGLPVVTRDYPGAEELVKNGKTGYIGGSEEILAGHLLELLADEEKRQKMGARAREYVQKFHGEKNLEKFVSLLV